MLADLRLDAVAEAVYRVALARSTWPRLELAGCAATSCGYPAQDVQTALDELLSLGLLQSSYELGEAGLRVLAPAVVLDPELERTREQVRAQEETLADATRWMGELQELYTQAREAHTEHTVERLTGLDAVRSRLEQLASGARREALSFMPGGAHSAESLQASRDLDEAALARGVSLRNIYLYSALHDPATGAYVRRLVELGAETRTTATLPMRLLIVDRRIALLPIDAERPRDGALLVRSPGIITGLLALFESVWLSGRPTGRRRANDEAQLSDTDREILRILASGATDEGLARQLGVSVRTVRRLTSELLVRFHARSRFELGLKMGSRSLLREGPRLPELGGDPPRRPPVHPEPSQGETIEGVAG